MCGLMAREAQRDVVWATLFLRRFGSDFWGEHVEPHPYSVRRRTMKTLIACVLVKHVLAADGMWWCCRVRWDAGSASGAAEQMAAGSGDRCLSNFLVPDRLCRG